MIPIYSLEEAQSRILKRKSIIDTSLPPHVNKRIIEIFGQNLTPQEVVIRIIKDVKESGDAALIEWTKKLDKMNAEFLF